MNAIQEKVLGLVDRNELVELALALGNISSPAGEEAEIGNFIHDWLDRNEHSPRRIGFVPERSCMAGVLPGTGDGISLAFNSHMDTARQLDDIVRKLPEAAGRAAWVDGKYIMAAGIVNDKGPMAAWMIAANAIRKSGVKLRGDLVLTMVPGEIDQEPVDEFTSTRYLSKEVGARYLITRGVVADYALVAEGTHFKLAWAGAGKACFKITILGKVMYIPYLPARTEPVQSPNAIVKTAAVIAGLEDWARDYEREHGPDPRRAGGPESEHRLDTRRHPLPHQYEQRGLSPLYGRAPCARRRSARDPGRLEARAGQLRRRWHGRAVYLPQGPGGRAYRPAGRGHRSDAFGAWIRCSPDRRCVLQQHVAGPHRFHRSRHPGPHLRTGRCECRLQTGHAGRRPRARCTFLRPDRARHVHARQETCRKGRCGSRPLASGPSPACRKSCP